MHMSSSYRSNRLGLSHWDPYAVHRCGCLELYYCNMVEWFWCDSDLISTTNWFPSVLWHCWFGHLTCKIIPEMTYNVLSGTLNLYATSYLSSPSEKHRTSLLLLFHIVIDVVQHGWYRAVRLRSLDSYCKWLVSSWSSSCSSGCCVRQCAAVKMTLDGVTDASFTSRPSSGFWLVCYLQIIYCICRGGDVIVSVCTFVCLSLPICEQDYSKKFSSEPCRIMYYCLGKNPLNSGVDLTENGQLAAISDLHYSLLRIIYYHQHSPGGASIVGLGRGMHSALIQVPVVDKCHNSCDSVDTEIMWHIVHWNVVTCEIKHWNNFKNISVFYCTCNHVWNLNTIIAAAERVLKLFQNYLSNIERVGRYLWAAISLWIILKEFQAG